MTNDTSPALASAGHPLMPIGEIRRDIQKGGASGRAARRTRPMLHWFGDYLMRDAGIEPTSAAGQRAARWPSQFQPMITVL